jgi:hypothetical protein
MHQDIARGGNNVSPPGQDVGRSVNSTEPMPQYTPVPTVIPTPAPTSRPSAFTVYAEGGKDHRPGETIRLYGMDTCSDAVYLFISCTKTPISGGRLNDLQKPVVDRDNTTFTRVNVSKDGSWEYFWDIPCSQPTLLFDLYEVIAVTEPRDKPHLDEAANWDMVTVKISEYRN